MRVFVELFNVVCHWMLLDVSHVQIPEHVNWAQAKSRAPEAASVPKCLLGVENEGGTAPMVVVDGQSPPKAGRFVSSAEGPFLTPHRSSEELVS